MNMSQINFGEVGAGRADQWHLDSVPYVMVVLLSDATDMEGAACAQNGCLVGGTARHNGLLGRQFLRLGCSSSP